MRYLGMPAGMWVLYKKSFTNAMVTELGYSKSKSAEIMRNAKPKYIEIIDKLPEFEKVDQFKMNIVNCALFAAVLLNIDEKPSMEALTKFYATGIMNLPTKWFCRIRSKRKFSDADVQGLKNTAALRAADRNPYSWNMDFLAYEDGSGYEARFTKCGICQLMKEYGLFEYVPAMCHLDYTMSEAGGTSKFVREYTLASGGPYCDCGYKKKASSGSVAYDKENKKPVIKASICNGEMVAGFQDIHTGAFEEVQLVRNDDEIRDFMRHYGITEKIEKIY